MNILIRQARIISPGSGFNNKIHDILIEGGVITAVKKAIPAKSSYRVIEGEGLMVSPGWVDMQAAINDPGHEHKEDLNALIAAAAAGGFTTVCGHSASHPPLHTKAQIEYVLNKTEGKVVNILPFGTITQDAKGKDIAEMYDMKLSGAAAFSDYKHSIPEAGTVLRALQYTTNIGALLVVHCNEASLSKGGQAHEGEAAVALGLKGIPALAEEIIVARNLSLLEYTGGRMHIALVSSRGSVDLIKRAKAAGLNVTCGVAASHLLFDEHAINEFDTNYKLDPPLRSKRDQQALRNGMLNGVIDVIVSDHQPQDVESKELEFDLAEPGMINLQTAFSCAVEALGEKAVPQIVKAMAVNPRKVLGMEMPVVAADTRANLTIFSVNGSMRFDGKTNKSTSKNSPILGQPVKGKVYGVINGSRSYFNS